MRRNVQRRSGSLLTTGRGMVEAPNGRGVRATTATLPTPRYSNYSPAVLVQSTRVTLDNIRLVQLDYGQRRGWGIGTVGLYLLGVFGLSASLTILWLGMRAVLDVGGYCAEGGPYVIAQHCPAGTALLIPLSIFAGLGSAALMAWEGAKLGSPWAALVGLACPAPFISLGWNFPQFAFPPPEGMDGIELGWLIPGVLFVIMGAVPLIGFLPGGTSWKPTTPEGPPDYDFAAEREARSPPERRGQRSQLLSDLVQAAERRAPTQGADPGDLPPGGADVVSKLERLSALYRAGSLTYDEFQRAKQATISEAA